MNGQVWAWGILVFSLMILFWRLGFNEPKLLEGIDDPRVTERMLRDETMSRGSKSLDEPRVSRSIDPSPDWDPSDDLLDALLEENFRIRDIVVRFPTKESLRDFVGEATERGLVIEDDLARLGLLRVRLANGRQARDLFELMPEESEPEPNYPVLAPDLPETENVRGISPFGADAVGWLDAPKDRASWGEGVLVAVLDTGVDFDHPALKGVKGTSLNLVEEESDELSYDGHATAIASIIAGNPEVIEGLAPKAEILSVRVLNGEGVGDGFTVANGILEAVDRGAHVINMSLGSQGPSFALEEAMRYAHEKNVLVVASVGNDGSEGVTYPARYNGVIGVAAIDAKGSQAYFSNFGEGVDIAAPGAGVHAAWSEESVVSFSGTSAATPYVAGALAGLLSQNHAIARERLPELLYTHANDDEMPGEDPYVGKGVLDLGRVVGRNVKGTYDVAITGYYFDPKDLKVAGATPFLVSIQNQGTAWVDRATLEINYGEVSKTLRFGNLGVGEVKSQELYLDAKQAKDPDGTRIASQLTLEGNEETDLDNNERISRITLPASEE